MALSNAERQKRHRERQKARLRNGAMKSLPQALAEVYSEWIRGDMMDMDGGHTLESLVAENVSECFSSIDPISLLSDSPAVAAPFGGIEYVEAVQRWKENYRAWNRKRKNKGDPPEPPPIPGVT